MDLQIGQPEFGKHGSIDMLWGRCIVGHTVLIAGGSTRHKHLCLKDNLGWVFGVGTIEGKIYAVLKQLSRHTLWSNNGNKYVHASRCIQYSFSLGLCIPVQ